MNTNPDQNHIELASAGAGKTYDLTSYVVEIIRRAAAVAPGARAGGDADAGEGRGSRPRDVVALTFSRAAAGEIFMRVVERLAKRALGEGPRDGGGDGGAAVRALRRFLDEENRCQIGTIDSFLQTMARLVAERVDVPQDFRIVDDDEAAAAREAAVEALLGEETEGKGTDALSRAFVRANRGGRRWSFVDGLTRDAKGLYADFLRAPDPDAWGNPARIWKAHPALRAKVGDIDDEAPDLALRARIASKARRLFDALADACRPSSKEKDEAFRKLVAFRDLAAAHPLSLLSDFTAEKFLAFANAGDGADAPVQFGRSPNKFTLLDKDTLLAPDGTNAKAHVQGLFEDVRILAARAACRRRQGQFELMRRFDEAYRREMSGRGIATFDDIPRILARAREADPFFHLDMEFAVDGTFRHLALDEFQDTSPEQWAAIRNLADEARSQANGDGRSLFVVGDVKQAIYGWRGGDSRLLADLAEDNRTFVERSRFSRRFGKEIARFVNAVFDAGSLRRSLLDDPSGGAQAPQGLAIDEWEKIWSGENGEPGHAVETPADMAADPRPEPGRVDVAEVSPSGSNPELADWAEAFAAEIRPRIEGAYARYRRLAAVPGAHVRKPEFAILVRKNDEGEAIADALRDLREPPVRWEGESSISDSPVVAALLDLLLLAEHPDPRSAAFHRVSCTPLPGLFGFRRQDGEWRRRVTSGDGEPYDIALSPEILGRDAVEGLARKGLQGLLAEWSGKIKDGMGAGGDAAENAFTASRLDSLVAAAGEWTRLPTRDKSMTAFIRHVRSRKERVEAGASSVKIVTIHRSKGLTFDQVFVLYFPPRGGFPDTKRVKETQSGASVGPFSEDYGRRVDWILDAGKELCRLPALADVAREDAARDIESYCTNYVAMTRARHSLVILLPKARQESKQSFLRHVLDVFRSDRGAFGWKRRPGVPPDDSGDGAWDDGAAADWVDGLGRGTKAKGEADKAWDAAVGASDAAWRAALAEGTSVPLRAVVRRGEPSGAEAFQQDAGNLFASGELPNEKGRGLHALLASIEWIDPDAPRNDLEVRILGSAWREAFLWTDGAVVWRERGYEMFRPEENIWETGQFDRVVFRGEGENRRATIYDFKTNARRKGESDEEFARRMRETYAGQMAAYRAALSRLCALPAERVSSILLLAATMASAECAG